MDQPGEHLREGDPYLCDRPPILACSNRRVSVADRDQCVPAGISGTAVGESQLEIEVAFVACTVFGKHAHRAGYGVFGEVPAG